MSDSVSAVRLLLVDDDGELCELVEQYLTTRGFEVHSEEDGASGLQKAQTGDYALMILDVNLPVIDGFEVLRRLRSGAEATRKLPVVMLTAHGDETDRIVGLELGADDYLPKPFNPRELLARLQAVLRRVADAAPAPPSTAPPSPELLQAGKLAINVGARSAHSDGREVPLTAVEFDVLLVLVRHVDRVVTRDELAHDGLKRRLLPLDRTLDMHISNLRAKLWPQGDGMEHLKTMRGVGYLLKSQ
ncbi:response regulator transcription factor [bacterium]|nr:MAG: response regulator transcription factor [bacterium]